MEQLKWQECADALNGTGGFDNGNKIDRHAKETDDKLKARKELAWYTNFMHSACLQFSGFLAKKKPLRTVSNSLHDAFIANCDNKGNSLTNVMIDLALQTKARGSMLILVDAEKSNPENYPKNLQQQIIQRSIPYISLIAPETIISFKLTKNGLFETITLQDTRLIEGKQEPVHRTITEQDWKITKGDEVLDSGEHGLGINPVLAFTESDNFPQVGSFYQIAEASKRYYNLMSELDDLLRSQTFGVLTYQTPDGIELESMQGVVETVGTNNLLIYQGERPDYIAPPAQSIEAYEKRLKAVKEEIDDIGLNVSGSNTQESGLALNYRFQKLNSQLIAFANRLEKLEAKIFILFNLYLNINTEITINYPSDYNLADLTWEIESFEKLSMLNVPKDYLNMKLLKIIKTDFPDISLKLESEIIAELNNASHER